MYIQKFLFQLVIILTYIIRVGLIVLPIASVIVITKEGGWKYGFTFIQNNFEVALFIAFAVGFLVALYHAVSFEIVGKGPLENYLKTHQNVNVSGQISLETLKQKIENASLRIKDVRLENDKLSFKKLVYFSSPDTVTIAKKENFFSIESKPFTRIWFIDFGRNFKTVTEIAKLIKRA